MTATTKPTSTPATGGRIQRVAGPVVTAIGLTPKMYDIVLVGTEELMGEVIKIQGEKSIIQVYEDTSGIRPGEPVQDTGLPLSVKLGPGLLTSIYDGILRPLPVLREKMGDFILRGLKAPPLDEEKKWAFTATAKAGDEITGGAQLGTVQETVTTLHRILLPPKGAGKIATLDSGEYTVNDVIGTLEDGTELKLAHDWPVRLPRPTIEKLLPTEPLLTGQRILDTMFPIAKGGTGAIPGGFGTGKTVTQQQLAKWSNAQIVVYIGCGERGNEMTEVLTEFPELVDPQSGEPLMNRTILIANTSNMPVAAREASVYVGMTLAEYYRDQGYDIALMADSTSRWAEAMREISSRLEEMPGEEGYPAYLASRLSEFYERAGRVKTLGGGEGSISVIGAVSPPGGDISEPVTQNTLRIVKVFWALDTKLRERRHFPAINWLDSYSLYSQQLSEWYRREVAADFQDLQSWAMQTLQTEDELQEIVQLVGSDSLPKEQQLLLEVARMIREFFLQQNAFHPVDTYSPIRRQYNLLRIIRDFGTLAEKALAGGHTIDAIISMQAKDDLGKSRYEEDTDNVLAKVEEDIKVAFAEMGVSL